MSFVITHPEALATAAGHLTGVGSVLAAQNVAAAAATTSLPPADADEVSALTATQFSAHAALYRGLKRPSRSNPPDVHPGFGHQCNGLCGDRSRQHHRN